MGGGSGQGLRGLLPWAGSGQPMASGPSTGYGVPLGTGQPMMGISGGAQDIGGQTTNIMNALGPMLSGGFPLGGGGGDPFAAPLPARTNFVPPTGREAMQGRGAPHGAAMTPAMLQILIKRMLGTS